MSARPPAVARVLERVTGAARRHQMFPDAATVLVACSGGPDSLCLLHALYRLRRLLGIRLAVFHFDHGLRRRSEDDAAYVQRQARRLGVPFLTRRAHDRPAPGDSVEAWARTARYAALSEAAIEAGADAAALGHTQDDQAETVLLGLIRGGGIEAVAGMPAVGSVPPLGLRAARPLLEVTREETERFCRALGLRPREDPHNRDPRFLRTRVRHRVIPALERSVDRGVRATLARTAENVRTDAEYLDGLASEAAHDVVEVGEGDVRLEAELLIELPRAIGARVVLQALRLAALAAGAGDTLPAAAHVEAVLDLARGRPGRQAELGGPLSAARDRRYVRISRASPGRA